MPASPRRRHLWIWLILALAVVAPQRDAAADLFAQPGAQIGERVQRVRAALEPSRPRVTQREALLRRRAPDRLRLLVVGCDFSDSLMVGRDLAAFPGWPAPRRQAQRIPGTGIAMFAAHDSVYFDLQMQRVDAYFRTVSFDRFHLEWDVHPVIVNLPRPMGYYADPDSGSLRLARMAQVIATQIDDEVDFTPFDTLLLVHAGAGSETDVDGDSPEQIPTQYLDRVDFAEAFEAGLLDAPRIVTAERDIEHALVLPESETQDPLPTVPGSGFFDVRGPWCYEIGQRLGMLSLADFTPAAFPDSQGIGNFGLMGYGLFTGLAIVPSAPSAINRMLMGWVDPVEVDRDASIRIAPMTAPADTNLVRVAISDREYWLLEYRLQDPDGDLFYTFGDLNGNRFPDYFDSSNVANGGVPDSTFDPARDRWESEYGADVDFFMTESGLRTADGCQRGGGSGIVIWHVDEQVIQNALDAGTNTINADYRHKGVDVEEADGLQDLDSVFSGEWLLGVDADVWRAEGNSRFGPDTRPSTVTASGEPTGIEISGISAVVLDSLDRVDGFCTGFVYAPSMSFEVSFGGGGAGPVEQARLRTDGFAPTSDLRGADLGAGPGSPAPDGRDEIVALADSGRVLVLDGALLPFAGGAEILAVAVSGDSLDWLGPPALTDLDGDGRLDVVAGSTAGPAGFDLDGQELIGGDGLPSTTGRLVDPGGRGASPLVVVDDRIVQAVQTGSGVRLLAIGYDTSSGRVELFSDPVADALAAGVLVAAGPDAVWAGYATPTTTGEARFRSLDTAVETRGSDEGFARTRAALVELPQLGPGAIWVDPSGRPRAAAGPGFRSSRSGPGVGTRASRPVPVPSRSDGSEWVVGIATPEGLWVLDANLSVLPGFPVRVQGRVVTAPKQQPPEPVAADLDGDGRVEFVWADASGVLHATDLDGRELRGWPLPGPASPVSAPVLGQFDGDPALELAVAGRFERLVPSDSDEGPARRTVGEIRVYDLGIESTTWRPWDQAGGGVDNRGRQALTTGVPGGTGVVDDSFSVRPNPVVGRTVRLRAEAAGAVAARLEIFTLEGERVFERGNLQVPAGTALDIEVDVGSLASGTYICQLTTSGKVQRRLLAVVR